MYGIIMAGGIGKRFWPMSTRKRPKQFLDLFSDRSLIRMTFDRLKPVIKSENTFVITNKSQARLTSTHLPDIPKGNIITEPLGKDTAPCIGLGALMAMNRDPEAVLAVLPADHLIQDEKEFRKILALGAELAIEKECLITIGISPSRPETGYGYIQIDKASGNKLLSENLRNKNIFKVKAFAEKPNLETAKRFLESGDFLWNSGIFVWKASTILNQIEEFLPELYDTLLDINKHINRSGFRKALQQGYSQIKSISIDYGVMEKAQNVFLIKSDFGWSDVGSWEEYYNLKKKDENGNVLIGNCTMLDSNNNLVIGDNKLISGIGLNDMIIVNTKDTLMICPRGDSQKVKSLVDYLRRNKMDKYL